MECAIGDYAGDIGAAVTWFPVTIHLKDANGDSTKIFLEVGANSRKIALTKNDGTTELKGEIEDWSYDAGTPANSTAIIHTSADGWTINANTSIWLYYDNDHAVNANVDVINTTPGAAVWDGNFLAVYHSVDDNGNIDDSTSNSYDGTKKGAGEPAEATGKIGLGQLYDGTDDYIANATLLDTTPAALTLEAVVKITAKTGSNQLIIDKENIAAEDRFQWFCGDNNTQTFSYEEHDGGYISVVYDTNWALNTYQYLAVTWDTVNGILLYKDGASDGSDAAATTLMANGTSEDFTLGVVPVSAIPFEGIIDEVRVSSVQRVAAWIKGTHNSLWDTLLTYGSEQTLGNVLFFGANF